MAEGKLTAKMERFVLAYLNLGNATQAAIQAGYSSHSARIMAAQNLAKPNIKARLVELQGTVAERAEDTVMSVVERQKRLSATAVVVPKAEPTHRDCISAIAELNKMDHVYEPGAVVDNRTVNIIVGTQEGKELVEQLTGGKIRGIGAPKEGEND